MSNLVSIITVNYYSEDEILGCLHSIKEFNTARIEFIVVSNSPLHSILKEQKPTINADIILHQNASNLGFAKACNIGAKLAQGDFVFFLNPDTRFLNDAIPKLLSCYQSIKKPGLIGPATLNDRNKEVPTAKNHLTKKYFISLVFPFLNRLLSSDSKTGHFKPLKTQAVPVLNGHALFLNFNSLITLEVWKRNFLCTGKKMISAYG
jgi:GT2 family glycosyltransferase